ncbi:28818_t:CDS:1, partial [Gigaspora margarita]
PENPTEKTWILPDLELEIFIQNQPNAATFTKSTPITKFKELATKIAKKFAKENNVSETIEQYTYYFYYYLKNYFNTATINDKIQDMDLKQALEFLVTSNINSHILDK